MNSGFFNQKIYKIIAYNHLSRQKATIQISN